METTLTPLMLCAIIIEHLFVLIFNNNNISVPLKNARGKFVAS